MEVLTGIDGAHLDALRARDEFFWLDLRDPSPAELQTLGAKLSLHPLALEDTLEWEQRPKVEPYGNHIFVVFYTVVPDPDDPLGMPTEVHVYVSGGFILTARRGTCVPLDVMRGRIGGEHPEDAEDYLVYRIFDALTDAYYPFISAAEVEVDALESQVLERPRREQLGRIYWLKQRVHGVERRVVAQRDYFPAAVDAIMGLDMLSHGTQTYLRDVSDHLAQVAGELARQGSDLVALTETFFNANANKLNQTATRLSVVATFFVVGTLITGFFGQNFGWLVRSLDSRMDFLIFGVGGLALPILGLSAYFWLRRDDWR